MASADARGWAAALFLPLLVGALGLVLLAEGWQKSVDEESVRKAAAVFLRDVQAMDLPGHPSSDEPLDAELGSVRIDGDDALVRVTLRDGEHWLRAEVRLRRVDSLWRGRTIDFPDLDRSESGD